MSIERALRVVAVLACLSLIPEFASAQSNATIAGVVKDSSGAVLPGVTVEAASPALIEKVRTVVTDGAGQYKIVNLVPGVYTVTFTLTGFNTVRREGIELTASFTATVNADLRVGSLQETITVSGETPTVDVQNVTQQRVMTRDIMSAVPAGMRSAAQLGVLIPGVTSTNQDVGGTAFSASAIAIHGSRLQEQTPLYDGMNYNNGQGRGGNFIAIVTNDATVQEISLETSGLSAESETSGIRTNLIPRDGGNTFRGLFIGVVHRPQSAERQPQRRPEGDRPDVVDDGEASPTTSIPRSAGRSSRTSCGSGGRSARRRRSSRWPGSSTT